MTGTDHRSHGLAGNDMAPDWPALESAEVEDVLATFPALSGQITINWHSPRPFSAAARVTTKAGEIFVKRHHMRVRRVNDLVVEHAFISHLREHDLPMPAVLADAEGRTVIARGDWTYEIHAIADGIDLYRDTLSWAPLTDTTQARTAGRMLARLHQASAGFKAPQRDTWILVSRDDCLRAPDLLAAIDTQCRQRPALADYLQQHDWRRELAPLATHHHALQPRLADLPRLWTHNDWHVSNLYWSGDAPDATISAVLDVGLAAPTFALNDLAIAIERNAVAWLHLDRGMQAIFPDTARALVEGYASVLPLAPPKRQLLADLLPVVHVDFALSEVEYFHGITGSTEHANVAYDTFLRGHAAWFDRAPGQALLQAVRSAA